MNPSAVDRQQQTFEPVPISARAARQFVAETLRSNGASEQVTRDYALVVSELATNIIEHGDGSQLVIFLDVAHSEWWEVEVVGGSTTPPERLLQPEMWSVASADEGSGRGLGIVRHLMDDILTGSSDGLVSIRCRRRKTDDE